jgi:hypothetical protein
MTRHEKFLGEIQLRIPTGAPKVASLIGALFALQPAGNLLDSMPGKDGQPVETTLGVVGDNRLRFY